jgi:SAM-dependent methyltransferase
MSDALIDRVVAYYEGRLAQHGATPAGVDWSSGISQQLRFDRLLHVCDRSGPFTVLDYGCGYGALADVLDPVDMMRSYTGYDRSPDMIAAASARMPATGRFRFTGSRSELEPADYTLASGIFNVKLDVPEDRWLAYVWDTLDDIASLSRRGFAFNALTSHSEAHRRRTDLFYADPAAVFETCIRRYSRFVSLLHDYPLWEFTILVQRSDGARV